MSSTLAAEEARAGADEHVCGTALCSHAAGIGSRFADLAEASEDLLFFGELLFLALPESGGFYFIGLIGEQVHLPEAGRLIHVVLLPLVGEFFPFCIGGRGACQKGRCCRLAVGVDSPALGFSSEKALVFALAVNIDQEFSHFPELFECNGLAADGADKPVVIFALDEDDI